MSIPAILCQLYDKSCAQPLFYDDKMTKNHPRLADFLLNSAQKSPSFCVLKIKKI